MDFVFGFFLMAVLSARRRSSPWTPSGGVSLHVQCELPGIIRGLAKKAFAALIAVPARLLI